MKGTARIDDYYCIAAWPCGDDPQNRSFAEPEVDGFKVGVHIGYNQEVGPFVLGAESDINFSNGSSDPAPFVFYDASDNQVYPGNPGETSAFAMLWEGSTRVKAGFALDRLMPYVTAGVAYGQARVDVHRISDFSSLVNVVGVTAGTGLAYAATDNIIVRGEARLTKFGDVVSADIIPGGDSQITQVSGPTIVSVEGGVSVKLDPAELDKGEPVFGYNVFDWTGIYIGVHGGFVKGTVRVDDYYCIAASPPLGPCGGGGDEADDRYFGEPNLEGLRGGVHMGYNQGVGALVLGFETDISFSNASSATVPFLFYDAGDDQVYDDRAPGETLALAMLWDGSTRVNAGFALDRILPYVTGGITYGQAHVDVHRIYGDPNNPNDPIVREPDFSHLVNLTGVTVGAGLAYAATNNIVVRGEARLTKFGDVVSGDIVPGGDSGIIQVSGPTTVSAEGGISFKF
jgi:outer membrane immunogenic protein